MANKIVRKSSKTIAVHGSAGESAALRETVYLLRSPKNARRLLSALSRAKAAKDRGGNSSSGRGRR
jgi:PHD/YefM family antitoxin component YafN of YafNO toxin-antitoxin module